MGSEVLKGQKALVTGANSGIGKEVARALAAAGASVMVNYVTARDAATELVEEIRGRGAEAEAFEADVSDEGQVRDMFRDLLGRFGTVDILVNNAGIQRDAAFADMGLQEWQEVLSVNLTGQFLCSREAVREFRRRGVVPAVSCAAGKIICMSSVHQEIPWSGHANYAASKGGVMMLMKTMAQELAPERIRVNGLCPGAIKTPINRDAWESEEAREKLLELIPYGRVGDPEDVARAAVWLASDDSDYVTGASLFVDGGMMLYPGFRTGG